MKEAISSIVTEGTSFADLEKFMQLKGFDINGEIHFTLDGNESIFVWAHLNNEFVKALTELLNDKVIVMNPTSPLVYYYDGTGVNLPIVKNINYHYKEPRWLPVVFQKNNKK